MHGVHFMVSVGTACSRDIPILPLLRDAIKWGTVYLKQWRTVLDKSFADSIILRDAEYRRISYVYRINPAMHISIS